jgi:hypothetical protein
MTLPLTAAGQVPVVRIFALSRVGAARELDYHPSLYKLRFR